MDKIPAYRLIRSGQKTLGLEVRLEGQEAVLYVRAPRNLSVARINDFIKRHEAWIKKRRNQLQQKVQTCKNIEPLCHEDRENLRRRAKHVFSEAVSQLGEQIGVRPDRIQIRFQKTRWGSCSNRGNISLNGLLVLAPPEVSEAVMIHELCHLREMNHSPRFYRLLSQYCPNYPEAEKWLKENGTELLALLGEASSGGGKSEKLPELAARKPVK